MPSRMPQPFRLYRRRPGVEARITRRQSYGGEHILEEDLRRVIDHAEKTGEKLYQPEQHTFLQTAGEAGLLLRGVLALSMAGIKFTRHTPIDS